ncbi:hypothetical protein F6V30_14380 [Oryzomonas sagensis]|uniref:Uncharacterized protein n=1 Tax=Oryzomonas sagensis TaxID=2603857 RepID=A0ABQ6TLD5_9BACT|nr:hypothetical protein [Oryzomonas sagensis]KAB0669020.1 hypothetical protein F6V30_14380 [Oryzomonas sagensis]
MKLYILSIIAVIITTAFSTFAAPPNFFTLDQVPKQSKPLSSGPLRGTDLPSVFVADARANEKNINNQCDNFKTAYNDYIQFNGSGQSRHNSPGENIAAEEYMNMQHKRFGGQVQSQWQSVQGSWPSGFNPQVCSGTMPTKTGSFTMSDGKLLRSEEITGWGRFDATYGPNHKYPVQITVSDGRNNALTGVKNSENEPFIVRSVNFDFLKLDPITQSYTSRYGSFTASGNELVDYFNVIERDCPILDIDKNRCHSALSWFGIMLKYPDDKTRQFTIDNLIQFAKAKNTR